MPWLPKFPDSESFQQACARFIATHPELIDRIKQISRAIDTQQANERHRLAVRGAPERHTYARSAIPAYGSSQPTPPAGPEI